MKLLPYDTFTIQTQDSLVVVIERLEAHIEAPKVYRTFFSRNHAPYAGRINVSGFEIYRIIHYRNSFLPMIRGRFEPSPQGIRVRVTMSLHPFVRGFLIFWYWVWYSATIPIFLLGALSGDVPFEALLFLGLPIFILFVFWQAFWNEATRSRHEITQLLSGQTVEEPISNGNLVTPRAILMGLGLLIAIALSFVGLSGTFSPYSLQSPESKSCSQDAIDSPYCNFSVVRTLEGHPTVSAIAISADGQTLVSGGQDKALKVWNLQTGELRRTLQSDSGAIQSVAIAPDGRTVVTGSGDRRVRIWDITSDRRPKMLKGHSSDIHQVRISSDGKTILSSSDGEIKIWDLTTGQLKATVPDSPPVETEIGSVTITREPLRFLPLDISPDGKTAVVKFGAKFAAWDLTTNQTIAFKKASIFFQPLNSARISLDGQTAIATFYQQPVTSFKVWDVATGTLKAEGRLSSSSKYYGVEAIALSRDRIISSTSEGLKVFNLQTAELEATLKQQQMRQLVTSSDGKMIAGIVERSDLQTHQIQVLQRP